MMEKNSAIRKSLSYSNNKKNYKVKKYFHEAVPLGTAFLLFLHTAFEPVKKACKDFAEL